MMSPARPLVIGAGSGICTFCAEWERWLILCCCKAILSRNYHHLTVRDTRVLTLHSQCGQYQFHSVQSDTWLQLLRQLTAVPSSGQLSQLSGPRLSHRQQHSSLSNSGTANFSGRHRWGWPGLHGTRMSSPGRDHLMWHYVTGVAGGVSWCPPPVSVSFPQCCGATAADLCGARVLRVTEERSELRLVTVSPSCVTDHQASWSGPWLTGILWEWECGIQKRHATVPVPRIITGPRRFPFGRIRPWLRASRFVVKKSTNRGPSAERQIDITISSYSGNWTQTDKHREAGGKWRNFVKTNKQIWEQNFDAVLPRQKLTSCLKLATLMTPTWHKQSQDKKRERQSNAAGWSVSIIVRISHKALQA